MRLKRIHHFCCDRYVYMWLSRGRAVVGFLPLQRLQLGLPLTDDSGKPLVPSTSARLESRLVVLRGQGRAGHSL